MSAGCRSPLLIAKASHQMVGGFFIPKTHPFRIFRSDFGKKVAYFQKNCAWKHLSDTVGIQNNAVRSLLRLVGHTLNRKNSQVAVLAFSTLALSNKVSLTNLNMKTLSIIAACVLLLIQSLQNLHAVTPTNGLVAFYPFDGNGNDASGNGRNLTIIDCGFTNGIRGQALNFAQGSSRADWLPSGGPNYTNTFSFSVWFKPDTITRDYPEWMYLVGGSSLYTNATLRLGVGSNNRQINFMSGGAAVANYGFWSTNMNVIRTNAWNHIVVTAQHGAGASLYFNGQLLATDTTNPDYWFDQNNFFFGNYLSSMYPFAGQMDQIRLYNRALTQAEVLGLYNLDHINYVTLVLKSSSDLSSWQPVVTNHIETYNPTEFYKTDITISDTPPAQ